MYDIGKTLDKVSQQATGIGEGRTKKGCRMTTLEMLCKCARMRYNLPGSRRKWQSGDTQKGVVSP